MKMNNNDYKLLYKDILMDCPEKIKKDFTKKLNNLANDYRTIITLKRIKEIKSIATDEEKEILKYILSGVSTKKIILMKISTNKIINDLKSKYNIPEPPKEIKESLRTLPGALKMSIIKYNNLAKINKTEITNKYNNGHSINSLAKEYYISSVDVKSILENPTRETSVVIRDKLLKKLNTKEDEWYLKTWEDHGEWSLVDFKNFIVENILNKENISEKTIYRFIDNLGIKTNEERRNKSRSIKSKNDANRSWKIKDKTIRLINESNYGSLDSLTKKYCNNEAGTYRQIANNLNKEFSTDHFTIRQVQKAIISNSNYIKSSSGKSRAELIFGEVLKRELKLSDNDILYNQKIDANSLSTMDFYIPKLGVAFEYNGDYWHSDEVIKYNYGISAKEFHLKKLNLCLENNIQLFYIWDSDFQDNSEEVIKAIVNKDYDNKILNKLERSNNRTYYSPPSNKVRKILKNNKIPFVKDGKFFDCGAVLIKDYSNAVNNYSFITEARKKNKELITVYPWHDPVKIAEFLRYKIFDEQKKIYARKTTIGSSNVLSSEDKQFIEDNHILGSILFRKVVSVQRLFFEDNLVALCLFTEIDNSTVELRRLAFLKNCSVVGGASKMFKNFIKCFGNNYSNIITFSDNNLSEGRVYSNLGFSLKTESKSVKVWFNPKTKQKFTDQTLYRIGADRLLRNMKGFTPYGVGDDLPSNAEIVSNHGFISVKDCGYKKWEKKIKLGDKNNE